MADKEWPVFETVEMHTGGEPVRIIETGYPDIPGAAFWQSGAMFATIWITSARPSCSSPAAITTCMA